MTTTTKKATFKYKSCGKTISAEVDERWIYIYKNLDSLTDKQIKQILSTEGK